MHHRLSKDAVVAPAAGDDASSGCQRRTGDVVAGDEALQELRSIPGFAASFEATALLDEATTLLRQARTAAGLTQRQVADRMRGNRKSVTAIENAFSRQSLSLKTFGKFLDACGYRLEFSAINNQTGKRLVIETRRECSS